MAQFEKAISGGPVACDICGEVMHPMYGGGWDNDRIVCASPDCGSEIEYPTSTPVKETKTTIERQTMKYKSKLAHMMETAADCMRKTARLMRGFDDAKIAAEGFKLTLDAENLDALRQEILQSAIDKQ